MPRENSFSDEDGRSLTPDLDEDWQEPRPPSPVYHRHSHEQPPKSPASSHRPAIPNNVHPPVTLSSNVRPPLTPRDRFRSSVRKVMQINRTSSMMLRTGVGAEPGVDVRRDSASITYGHLKQRCLINLVDYSSVRSSSGRMTDREFVNYLNDPNASAREPWAKVRWINIGGLNWDVLRALAIKYDLHPLALEDVLSHHNHLRSKADYYQNHLFLRVISHTLTQAGSSPDQLMEHLPRSESPEPVERLEPDEGYSSTTGLKSRLRGAGKSQRNGTRSQPFVDVENNYDSNSPTSVKFASFAPSVGAKYNAMAMRLVKELNGGERVNVALNPLCIFLLRDGTVISIHPKNDLEFTAPIQARLSQRHTGLRSTADPSLLVHSLLDLVVDAALEVVDEYQKKIVKLEHDILLRPRMKTVRFLHILSGDLILHKRTLTPIKTLIYGLRRYDADRVAALYDTATFPKGWKPEGYMSHKATIYLADVFDHMEYILTSMEMFAGISENLINYTFNMASYQMNQVMRKLTLVTIICLPLSLMTGYFGMNFVNMWSIQAHSDVFFWEIAIPLMMFLIPLLTWTDMVKMFHFVQKKVLETKVEKRLKRA